MEGHDLTQEEAIMSKNMFLLEVSCIAKATSSNNDYVVCTLLKVYYLRLTLSITLMDNFSMTTFIGIVCEPKLCLFTPI